MKTLYKLPIKRKLLKDFYVFDVETTPFKIGERPTFIFGAIYGWKSIKVLHSIEEFQAEFLKDEYKNKKVFAHNAEFDLDVIYDNIYNIDSKAIFNGKFISASNGNCIFADSMSIYVGYSVARLGQLVGLPKLEIDYELMKTDKKSIEYCIRDCEIVYKALIFFFETVGDIKITQASLSMTYFRRHFLKHHIQYNEHTNDFFKTYFGGRVEVFKLGKTNAKVFDFNSMYTGAMRDTIFPNPKYLKKEINVNAKKFKRHHLKYYEGMAHLVVHHKETKFGFLPYKMKTKQGNKLVFPVGDFSGFWNFNEIRFALENDAIEILEVREVIFAVSMESPLKEFAESMYKLRFETEDKLLIDIWKRLANSLYGKFAQRIDTEMEYIPDLAAALDYKEHLEKEGKLKRILFFNSERNDCFFETGKDESYEISYCIPVFASYITSYARIKLLESMIKYQDFNPVYCDTDSIFLEEIPLDIEDSKELGKLKMEDKTVSEIRGLKNYTFAKEDGIVINRIKGIPSSAINISGHIYEYKNLVKTKESLRRNIETNVQLVRTKEIKSRYDKRVVFENGETKPLYINETIQEK
jgi:hypothetical protein